MKSPLILTAAVALAVLAVDAVAQQPQSRPGSTPKATKPVATKPVATKPSSGKPASGSATPAAQAPAKDSAAVPAAESERVKSVYVVPMGFPGTGQFGLDIHPMVYEKVSADIAEKKPDIVVYVLHSADVDQVAYMGDDPTERGIFEDDSMRDGMRKLKEAVKQSGAEQVMVIRDAVGYGALLGLYWPDMYMTSRARLAGLNRIQERTQVEDTEVRAKFQEAFVGICNGFLVSGGYADVIGLAMMRPEKMLSATYKGRDIVWSDTDKGAWVVDNAADRVAGFTAQSAEELGLSDGTVADEDGAMLEDLMFQRGIREFQRIPSDGEALVRAYVDGWRKSLEECRKSFDSFQEAMGNASGKEEKKYLSQARTILERVLAAFKKYPAVAMRARSFGAGKLQLEVELEKIKERIRGLSKSAPTKGGGSGKGPAGPGLGTGG
ncbi:MAG: hypothetical protein EXS03_01295 [Phycisphaerales bacterium]|nr:hypothetical protein [Phycisphaerales bacterium]